MNHYLPTYFIHRYFGDRYEWLYVILVEYMSSILDHVVGGGLMLGMGSFVAYKYHDLREAQEMQDFNGIFFFIATLASGDNRVWRGFAVAGIGYAYIIMYSRVSVRTLFLFIYLSLFYYLDVNNCSS